MALPDLVREKANWLLARYCARRVPVHLGSRLRLQYRFRGNMVTIFERRPAFRSPGEWTRSAVAQFRFDPVTSLWTLYCRDRNTRWHRYAPAAASLDLRELLGEVDADPTGIFWG